MIRRKCELATRSLAVVLECLCPESKELNDTNRRDLMTKRRYPSAEFNRGADISRMDASTIALARQVLVEGRRQADVAREAGVVRQRISALVSKMQTYIEEANPIPAGWRADTVVLPLEDWPRVREIEKAAREALARRENRRRPASKR